GRVPLTDINVQVPYASNIRQAETIWRYNTIRDIAIPGVPFLRGFYDDYIVDAAALATNKMWYNTGRFIDKYAIVRFEYTNLFDRQFLFLDHTLYHRQSIR
ncbi:MAG: hypothetical protein JSW41_05950, partial [Candidatus Aenigmatarchaeota archaeon]